MPNDPRNRAYVDVLGVEVDDSEVEVDDLELEVDDFDVLRRTSAIGKVLGESNAYDVDDDVVVDWVLLLLLLLLVDDVLSTRKPIEFY